MQDLDPQHIRVTVSATDDTIARALADRIASWWNAAGSIEIRARIRENTDAAPESGIAWVDLPLALESEVEEASDVPRPDGGELGNRVQLPSEYPWVATASPDELLSQFSSESSARSFAVDVPALAANGGAPPSVLKWHSPGVFHRFVENVQAATWPPGVPPRKFVAAISILSIAVLAVLAVSSGRQLDARSSSAAEPTAAIETGENVADIELPAAVPTATDAAVLPTERRRSAAPADGSVATGSIGRTTRGITTVAAQSQEAAAGKYVAALLVTSEPSGAIVEVDGVRRGATPLRVTRLPVGSHAVQVAMDGHALWSTAARVVFGQDNRVVARLAKQAQYR